jgi:hypothetical protein
MSKKLTLLENGPISNIDEIAYDKLRGSATVPNQVNLAGQVKFGRLPRDYTPNKIWIIWKNFAKY